MTEKKDEAYWERWMEEHDMPAMIAEVIDLGQSIYDGKGTLTDAQVVVRGRRQAELIHELLEWYDHPDDVADLAEDLDMSVDTIMRFNLAHLAIRDDGSMANPALN